jgi:hypothetical protein
MGDEAKAEFKGEAHGTWFMPEPEPEPEVKPEPEPPVKPEVNDQEA